MYDQEPLALSQDTHLLGKSMRQEARRQETNELSESPTSQEHPLHSRQITADEESYGTSSRNCRFTEQFLEVRKPQCSVLMTD